MDFAIIETGGKQYKLIPGKPLQIELLPAAQQGSTVTFNKVLMVVDGDKVEVGTPYIQDAALELEVEKAVKGPKVRILRFRAKSRYRRHKGHRQHLIQVKEKTVATVEPKAKKTVAHKASAAKPNKSVAKAAKKASKN